MTSLDDHLLTAALGIWAESRRMARFPIRGESMTPLLRPGDVVEIVHALGGFRPGDVLAYRSAAGIVVHRFCGYLSNGTLRMAGDHLPSCDAPVPGARVLGRVVSVLTPGGRLDLESRLARVYGRALVFLLPLREYRGLRRIPAWISRLVAWMMRR